MICPLCNEEVKTIIVNKLRHGENKDVYFCKICELGILDDDKTEKELKKFYEDDYRSQHTPSIRTAEQIFNTYEKYQEDRIHLISPFLNKNMKLLEIGCSSGQFLYHIKDKVKEIKGIEYDKDAANFASSKCNCDININVNQKFNIIVMLQVLEHMKFPLKYLKYIKTFMEPEALIYIEVPNLYDALLMAYDLQNYKQFYFHNAHLWYFSQKSLEKMMNLAGFKGEIEYTQDYNFMNHMHWLTTDLPELDCNNLGKIRIPLRNNLYNPIQKFLENMDNEYKELLKFLRITSNISYIGTLT